MFLGAIVIVVVGVLVFNYFKSIESTQNQQLADAVNEDVDIASNEHTIKAGESLWTISEEYYGSGEKWIDIARENSLENPAGIEEGQVIVIPNLDQEDGDLAMAESNESGEEQATEGEESEAMTSEDENQEDEGDISVDEALDVIAGKEIAEDVMEAVEETIGATATPTPTLVPTATPEPTATPTPEVVEEVVEETTPTPMLLDEAMSDENEEAVSEDSGNEEIPETYTVQRGDSLWSIAENIYGDGYRWTDIAQANDLANPQVIHAGNVFVLPN